jgi:S1-C subfamily serine protease
MKRDAGWLRRLGTLIAVGTTLSLAAAAADAPRQTIADAARKVVKIYGAGGLRGLESYQTGILVSPRGHVLTVMSTVLDGDEIDCVLDDGVRYRGTLLGADPARQLAVITLDAVDLPFFAIAEAEPVAVATRVLALSNLFGVAVGDERVSVQHGVVTARVPLEARLGGYEVPFNGDVYIVDCTTNNPGSPGGGLVDWEGRLVGMLGKELRASSSGVWLSYAIPVTELARGYQDILTGTVASPPSRDAVTFDPLALGIVLVPDLLDRTPPFVESVVSGSPAERAGLAPDDLVIAVDGRAVPSRDAVQKALGMLADGDPVRIAVVRAGRVIEADLGPRPSIAAVSRPEVPVVEQDR